MCSQYPSFGESWNFLLNLHYRNINRLVENHEFFTLFLHHSGSSLRIPYLHILDYTCSKIVTFLPPFVVRYIFRYLWKNWEGGGIGLLFIPKKCHHFGLFCWVLSLVIIIGFVSLLKGKTSPRCKPHLYRKDVDY